MPPLFANDSPRCPILVMIGVSASATDAALQSEPRSRVVIVEPDNDLAALIKTRHAGQSGLTVLTAAVTVAEETGPVTLVQYNQPGLRSSLPPTDHLMRLFPGLKPRQTQDVRSIALAQVWQDAGLAPEEQDGSQANPQDKAELWLDIGGCEQELMQGIIDRDGLNHVARIVLRCGKEPLFDGALGAADLVTLLGLQGFALVGDVGDDPDLPELHFERDTVLMELRQKLADQQRAQDQARDQYAALEAKFKTVGIGHDAQISALQAQLATALENLTETTSALEIESGTVSRIEDKLGQALKKIDQFDRELSAQAAQATEREQKAQAEADKVAFTAQADLALALRMQTLAQSDLRELQTRYDRVERTCQSQAALLQKLTPRLQQAAEQLQALTLIEDPYHVAEPSGRSLPAAEEAQMQATSPVRTRSAKPGSVKSKAAKSGPVKRARQPSPKRENPR